MPQEFYALQCYSCGMYQVHILKKKPKWECKMCNEKQSVIKVILRSFSAKDCRVQVQKLNAGNIQVSETESIINQDDIESSDLSTLEDIEGNCAKGYTGSNTHEPMLSELPSSKSKWLKYMKKDQIKETIMRSTNSAEFTKQDQNDTAKIYKTKCIIGLENSSDDNNCENKRQKRIHDFDFMENSANKVNKNDNCDYPYSRFKVNSYCVDKQNKTQLNNLDNVNKSSNKQTDKTKYAQSNHASKWSKYLELSSNKLQNGDSADSVMKAVKQSQLVDISSLGIPRSKLESHEIRHEKSIIKDHVANSIFSDCGEENLDFSI